MITPSPHEEEQLRVLGDRLLDPLSRAWDLLGKTDPQTSAPLREATRASMLHDHFVQEASATFDGDPTWRLSEDEQLWMLTSDFAMVRFNKVDNTRCAATNRTQRSMEWNHGAVDLFGNKPLLALRFTYMVDPVWSTIVEAAITQQVGRSVRWFLPFTPASDDLIDVMPKSVRDRSIRLVGDKLLRQMEIEEARRKNREHHEN